MFRGPKNFTPKKSTRFDRAWLVLKKFTSCDAINRLQAEDRVTAQMVHTLVCLCIPLIAINVVALAWLSLESLAAIDGAFLCSLVAILILNSRSQFRAAKISLLLSSSIFIFSLVVVLPADTNVAWCFLLVLFFSEQIFANEKEAKHRLAFYGPVLPVALFAVQEFSNFDQWKIMIEGSYIVFIRNMVWITSASIFYAQTRLWIYYKDEVRDQIAASTSFNTTLINNLLLGVYTADGKGKGTSANPFMAELTGRADGPELAQEWMDNVHPDDAALFRREFAELLSAKRNLIQRQLRMVRNDGRVLWVQNTTVPFFDHNGRPLGFIGSLLDVTEQVRAQRDLRLAMQALDMVAIVAETDQSGRILEVNENFCKISGYERDELIGQDHRIINSGHHPRSFFRNLWATISADRIWTGEIQNRRKDGSIYWVHTVIAPIFDESGLERRYLVLRFDISAQKEIQKKMIESSKMSTLGEMAGGIAHEINSPLAIIHGKAVQLKRQAQRQTLDPSKLSEGLDVIENTAMRISKIVKGLRTFSRSSDLDPMEPVAVGPIIDDTLSLCRERFKHHGVELRSSGDMQLQVVGRAVALSQVMMNLLNNSLDAVEYLQEKWVAVDVTVRAERTVVIAVMDSGMGIPRPVAEKMMQPFFTTKEIGKGTGLGLSISLGIVNEHGGRIYYDFNSPHTRIVVELPLHQAGKLEDAA